MNRTNGHSSSRALVPGTTPPRPFPSVTRPSPRAFTASPTDTARSAKRQKTAHHAVLPQQRAGPVEKEVILISSDEEDGTKTAAQISPISQTCQIPAAGPARTSGPSPRTVLPSVESGVHYSGKRGPATPQKRTRTTKTSTPARTKTRAALPDGAVASRLLVHSPRPYLAADVRQFLASAAGEAAVASSRLLRRGTTPASVVVHVDFEAAEAQQLLQAVRTALGRADAATAKGSSSCPFRELGRLVRREASDRDDDMASTVDRITQLTQARGPPAGRTAEDVAGFLLDVAVQRQRQRPRPSASLSSLSMLTLERHNRRRLAARRRSSRLSGLLALREMAGQRAVAGGTTSGGSRSGGGGRVRAAAGVFDQRNAARQLREDSLRLRREWTSCAGDVATIAWTSAGAFVCGTTTHMDQYNRQGNLVLGSVAAGTLRAFPDHRVATATTATAGRHADPWLYTSVVWSDYDANYGFAFTAGFDQTVKVWRVQPSGASMFLMGTWRHGGKVNFVVAARHASGLVATAADVATHAVRVYRLPGPATGGRITYKTFSGARLVDLEGQPLAADRWAYLPAAVRWGLAPEARHLLLVGYSPRSLGAGADDDDIPEDRRNSGELCLWDGLTGESMRISGGTSQNVFEVAWHPSKPVFAAATSPVGQSVEDGVRTQVRLFYPTDGEDHAFSEVKVLDCFADDINELALLPNSSAFLYAAAGCTNGYTYVWDTAQGDKPIHELAHGPCIEEQAGDKISVEDTGVKFVAWGDTPDRLYTGSSDGLVKVWNVRSAAPFVRNLVECKSAVSSGAFSPDKSKLAVGDASGRLFLLSVEDGADDSEGFLSEEEEARKPKKKEKKEKKAPPVRLHPPEIIRHPTPPPPSLPEKPDSGMASKDADADSGAARARAYLRTGQLVRTADPTIGAVQGPHYADTGLFYRSAHLDSDPQQPLLAAYERDQQAFLRSAGHDTLSLSPFRRRALRDVWLAEAEDDDNAGVPLLEYRGYGEYDDSYHGCGVWATPQARQQARQQARARTRRQHRQNTAADLDVAALPDETRAALVRADRGALALAEQPDYAFAYEEMPDW